MSKTWLPSTAKLTPEQLVAIAARDHAEITALIDRLRAALEAADCDLVQSLSRELLLVEIRHFAKEDALMRAIAYDQAEAHRAEHAAMLDALSGIVQSLAPENLTSLGPAIAAHLETMLHHVVDADRRLDHHA